MDLGTAYELFEEYVQCLKNGQRGRQQEITDELTETNFTIRKDEERSHVESKNDKKNVIFYTLLLTEQTEAGEIILDDCRMRATIYYAPLDILTDYDEEFLRAARLRMP